MQPLLGFEQTEEKQEDERKPKNKERKTASSLPGSAVHGGGGRCRMEDEDISCHPVFWQGCDLPTTLESDFPGPNALPDT